MLIGVIADDFTGAGDIANTLAKGLPGQGGLTVAQYIGIPKTSARPEIEAGVIALKSRSLPAAEAISLSLTALDWLLAQGCEQIVFKYCSTFDSTPEGNIGPVGEALASALGVAGVVACPAFPAVGRTVHQGHLFVHDRLLDESGMESHPLTPMTDPDLRRWLARQTQAPVGLISAGTVREGAEAVKAGLDAAAERGEVLAIADAAIEADLIALAEGVGGARLVTGGSGIALGLPANLIAGGKARGKRPAFAGLDGPDAILAGSCSGATLAQIEAHKAAGHPVMSISVEEVMAGKITAAELTAFVCANQGSAPLVYSSGTPEAVAASQKLYGREAVAARLDRLFAAAARTLVNSGVTRLVVAGGETSGAVVQALELGAFRIGPEIDPGVPILTGECGNVALALKSGNFGGRGFFAKALAALKGDAG